MTRIVYTLNEDHRRHAEPGHPERPERLEAIRQQLQTLPAACRPVHMEGQKAPEATLRLIHTPDYLHALPERCAREGYLDPDTYCTPESPAVARSAVGHLLTVSEAVLTGQAEAGFALIRPPGHHARPTAAMGFCLLNNVAIAVAHARKQGLIRRAAIIDFDVHHGNGTQEAFYRDPDVLFISSHEFPLYPGTGRMDEIGEGPGHGTTVNIPLPAGTGDEALIEIYRAIVWPILERFAPDAVWISAGYDAHWRDPLANLQLSARGYYALVSDLHAWSRKVTGRGPILTLEGGYDTEALAVSVAATLCALAGENMPPDPVGPAPLPSIRSLPDRIAQLKALHHLR